MVLAFCFSSFLVYIFLCFITIALIELIVL